MSAFARELCNDVGKSGAGDHAFEFHFLPADRAINGYGCHRMPRFFETLCCFTLLRVSEVRSPGMPKVLHATSLVEYAAEEGAIARRTSLCRNAPCCLDGVGAGFHIANRQIARSALERARRGHF